MKVFHQCGLRFDAVAGTSVGALNAAIWSTGGFDKGAELWENLSQASVYPYRRLGYLAFLFVSPAMALKEQLDGSLEKPASGLARGVAIAFSLFALICFMPSVHSATYKETGSLWITLGVDVLAYLFISVVTWLSWMKQTIVLVSIPMALISGASMLYNLVTRHTLGIESIPDFLVQLFCIVLVSALLISRTSLSAMTSEPLRRSVQDLLQNGLKVPIYVTTGTKREVYDPDNVKYYEMHVYGAPLKVTREIRSEYFPEYHSLKSETPESQLDLLLASAALPFGIVPAIPHKGKPLVDGGVVDNVPCYPLIRYEKCVELVVIYLEPAGEAPVADLQLKEWQRIHRLFRIRDLVPPDIESRFPVDRANNPPTEVPYEQPGTWPAKVINCHPRESLGGFRDGTLRFKADYARRLIAMGEQDAAALIKAHWPELSDKLSPQT